MRLLEIDARLTVVPAQVRSESRRAPPLVGARLAEAERLLGDSSRT
jgi:hypothetical protein